MRRKQKKGFLFVTLFVCCLLFDLFVARWQLDMATISVLCLGCTCPPTFDNWRKKSLLLAGEWKEFT